MKELKDIPKKNPFKVPENYFEELEGRIISATKGLQPKPAGKGVIRRLIPYLAIAASVALLSIIGYSVFYNGPGLNGSKMSPAITVNEFTETLLNDIDLMTLEDKVAESGILEGTTGVSKGDIVEYLISENIDVTEIYENL